MNRKKRVISRMIGLFSANVFLITNILISVLFAVPVMAADYYTEGFFKYSIVNQEYISIHSYYGTEKEVVIPDSIAGLPVLCIEAKAFYGNSAVEKITIPYTVREIGEDAFGNMPALKEIVTQSEGVSDKISDSLEDNKPKPDPEEQEPEQSLEEKSPEPDNGEQEPEQSLEVESPENSTEESKNDNVENNTPENKTETDTSKEQESQPDTQKDTQPDTQPETQPDAQQETQQDVQPDTQPESKDVVIKVEEPENKQFSQEQLNKIVIAEEYEEDEQKRIDVPGMKDTYITVDENKHLMIENADEGVVLDDSQKYAISEDQDGNIRITDEKGNPVVVDEKGEIHFSNKEGETIAENASNLISSDSEIVDTVMDDMGKKQSNRYLLWIAFGVVLVVLAGAGIVFWKKKRKQAL